MIVVKAPLMNKDGFRQRDYIEMSTGVEDQYGNPFEIIELQWISSRLHRNTDYQKTRGFEDAIIEFPRGSELPRIRYRPNGSIHWIRRTPGRGPWRGQVAKTPKNMQRLAKTYGWRQWKILNPAIEAEVRALHDKWWESLSDEQRVAVENNIRLYNTLPSEQEQVGNEIPEADPRQERADLTEEHRQLIIKRKELEEREERIKDRESKVNASQAEKTAETGMSGAMTRQMLESMKMHEVRKVARQILGASIPLEMKKSDIIEKVLDLNPQKTEVETVTG
jgi:hypothetical protein